MRMNINEDHIERASIAVFAINTLVLWWAVPIDGLLTTLFAHLIVGLILSPIYIPVLIAQLSVLMLAQALLVHSLNLGNKRIKPKG